MKQLKNFFSSGFSKASFFWSHRTKLFFYTKARKSKELEKIVNVNEDFPPFFDRKSRKRETFGELEEVLKSS